MKDSDKISKNDFIGGQLAGYDGRFGYPTYGELIPLLPSYFFDTKATWEGWDQCNKATVLMRWLDLQETRAFVERETKQLAESQKRHAAEEADRKSREESERQARLAKDAIRQADREHGRQIVAMQSECSARKKTDALIDEANELVLNAGKLVGILRRIPTDRLHEVDTESFLFNCGRVKQITNP